MLTVVSTAILARILLPEDFGLVAMVSVVKGFANMFRDLGLSSASIQAKDLKPVQQSNLYWLNLLAGLGLTVFFALASPLVAMIYGDSRLTAVTAAIGVSFLLGSFGTQPGAKLTKEMRFSILALGKIAGALTNLVVAVVLALSGFSYWSLIWGTLSGVLVTTLINIVFAKLPVQRPVRGTGMRALVGFGANVSLFNVINYFHRNLDNFLIGVFYGPGPLGIYSKAYSLLMLPLNTLRNPLTQVAFPALSGMKDNPKRFRGYYRRLTGLLALLSIPLVVFLMVKSETVILILLGEKWIQAASVFSVLGIAAFLQAPVSLNGVVCMSAGNGKNLVKAGLVSAIITSIGFVVGINYGIIGVAVSYAVTRYITLFPVTIITFRDTPVKISDLFSVIFRPAAAALLIGAISYILIQAGFGLDNLILDLGLSAIIFGLGYLLFLICLGGKNQLEEAFELVPDAFPFIKKGLRKA